ncbi:MAG: cupredoxin domain-containing protein [Ardenticatenia bacterium]|nr:cupredoxin domain-containing protein [Ardenticatenia bacterium]
MTEQQEQQQQQRPGILLIALLVAFVVALVAVIYADDVSAAVQRPFAATPGPDGTVEIVLEDFRFSPSVIRVKAGQRVRLVLRNEGLHTHEFMVGRQVVLEEGVTEPPEPDFFEGMMDVNVEIISGLAMPMGFGMEEMEGDMGMGGMGGGDEMGGMGDMGGDMTGPMGLLLPGPHGEGLAMGEVHGSMVMMEPFSEAVIEFTGRPTRWARGCSVASRRMASTMTAECAVC